MTRNLISAEEYRIEKEKLLTEYEQRVRSFLSEKGNAGLAEKIPFFRDGVVCPEQWFREGNDFRPLFILKEVSMGINEEKELDRYLKKWGNPKYFEFAENPFEDIQNGLSITRTWQKIVKLSKGLEVIHNGAETFDYTNYDVSYIAGEKYDGTIEGYVCEVPYRTGNPNYLDVVKKIAVMDIKKIGGGKDAASPISLASIHYMEHIEPFKDLLCRQIELIHPTVIVCCGREWNDWLGNWIRKQLPEIRENFHDIIWINEYHPRARVKNQAFFDEVLEEYKSKRRL